MPEQQPFSGAIPAHGAPSAPAIISSDKLSEFFGEVNALAIGLKRIAARNQRQGALPEGERTVLEIVERQGPLTVPEIACVRSTSRQNIQILANKLVADGLLEVATNPAHKRSVLLRLSSSGKEVLSKSRPGTNPFPTLASAVSSSNLDSATQTLAEIRRLLTETANGAEGTQRPACHPDHPEENYSDPRGRNLYSEPDRARIPAGEVSQEDIGSGQLPVNLL